MKNYILIIVSFFISSISFAQNKNLDYKSALKIYNLSTWQKTIPSDSSDNNYDRSYLQVFHPTIAYSWKAKKQNFHELELTTLIIKDDNSAYVAFLSGSASPNPNSQIISTAVSLRYEYIVNFFKTSDCKLAPSLGLALNPYFNRTKINPLNTTSFPATIVNFGLKYSLIPRLTYYYSQKCFFDINIPLDIFEMKNTMRDIRNPAVPNRQQRTATPDVKIFPQQFSLRVGFGIKL